MQYVNTQSHEYILELINRDLNYDKAFTQLVPANALPFSLRRHTKNGNWAIYVDRFYSVYVLYGNTLLRPEY